MFRTHLLVASAIALSLTASGPATAQSYPAQSYPDRPIRLIVPFPPGGPTDYVARLVAQHVSANFGQVVLDNRPGAGGTIASKAVANADPDGYTLLYGSSATLGIAPALYKNVEYDPIKSFAPVALVSRVPFVLGVAAAVPANTLSEFIAYAKANPGKLNFGATIGTPPHLVGELFKVTTGADIYYIPYKGAAQAMTDSARGPDAHDHRGRHHPPRAHSIGQSQTVGGDEPAAPARVAGCADDARKRVQRISIRILDRRARPRGHAGIDREQAQRGGQRRPPVARDQRELR